MRLSIILLILLLTVLPVQAATNLSSECFTSDLCILKEAVNGIKLEDMKTDQGQRNALEVAYYVTFLGNDELRQTILEKIEEIPDTRQDDLYSKTKTKMRLLASLGRIPDVMKMLQTLKDRHGAVSDGLEPQKDILVTLATIGKLDEAKKFALEADNIKFERPRGGPTEDPMFRKWTYANTPAILVFTAFLNQEKLEDALEIRTRFQKEDSIFLHGSYSVPDPLEKTNIITDGIFARYYLAKGTSELMKKHRNICVSMASKLQPIPPHDLILIANQTKSPFTPTPKSVSEDEISLRTLIYSGCLEKYSDIKTEAKKYSIVSKYIHAPRTRLAERSSDTDRDKTAKNREQIYTNCVSSPKKQNNPSCLLMSLKSAAIKKELAQNILEEFYLKYPPQYTNLQ